MPGRRVRWINERPSTLGAPVPIRQGQIYRSRWLVALQPPQIASCADAESALRNLLAQAAQQPSWPWQGLSVVDPNSAPMVPWPERRKYPLWKHPGSCLVFLSGIWKDQDTQIDPAGAAPIPGAHLLDFWTHGKPISVDPEVLVDFEVPGCAPGQETEYDFLAGEFKCVGVPTQPAPPPPAPPPPAPVPVPTGPCLPGHEMQLDFQTGIYRCVPPNTPCPAGTIRRAGGAPGVVVCEPAVAAPAPAPAPVPAPVPAPAAPRRSKSSTGAWVLAGVGVAVAVTAVALSGRS